MPVAMRFWSLLVLWAAFFAACYGLWRWSESALLRERQLKAWEHEENIEATEAALDRPLRLGERWLALHELPAVTERVTGASVEFDAAGLKAAGVTAETPLARLRGTFSARAALSHWLAPLGLGYDVRDGRIVITSPDRMSDPTELQTVVYPLPQPDFAAAAVDHEVWYDLVTTIVQPESWDIVGGSAHCESMPGGLVIVQTRSAHRELRRLFQTLGSLRSPPESFAPVPIMPYQRPEVWQQFRDSLGESTSVAADGLPLDDLIAALGERHGIAMLINVRKLEEAGVAPNTPITMQLANVSLTTVLDRLLDDKELSYAIHDEALVVTTPEDCESPDSMLLAAHPVHDLVEWLEDTRAADYDSLIDMIEAIIAPESWVDVGGPGSIEELDGWLLISQTYAIHGRVERTLADLRSVLSYKSSSPVLTLGQSAGERRLRDALARPTLARFVEEPLERALTRLGEQSGVPIVVDQRRFEEAGVHSQTPISCDLAPRPLAAQLQLILEQLELAATIRDDVVLVSTPEHIESPDYCPVRVYDVRPLADPDFGITDAGQLIDAITTLVTPESWSDVGGPASIREFRGLLVVCHTDAGHRQLEQLFAALEAHCLRGPPRGDEPPWVIPISRAPGDEEVEQLLGRTVDVDLHSEPLDTAIRNLADRHGVPVVFDGRRLSEAGVNLDAPVTLAARGIALEAALRLVLDEHDIIMRVWQGALVISIDERSPADFPLVAYRVDRLLADGADPLIDLVATVVEPESWVDVGGPGAIKEVGQWLLVSQSREVQQKIVRLLGELRSGAINKPSPAEQRVRAALAREVAMQFHRVPLGDALAALARTADVPLVVSEMRLEEAGVDLQTSVSIDVPPAPLAAQLRLLLEPLHLAYGVQHEVLFVATPEELDRECRLAIRTYDCRSLPGNRALADFEASRAEHIVTTLIDGESWVDVGGFGAAREFQGRLVVLHRDNIHEQIGRLLAAIDRNCRLAAAGPDDQPLMIDVNGNPREEAIERALGRNVSLELRGQPMAAALSSLAAEHGISLVVDERVLTEASCDRSRPIIFSARGVTLGGALDRLLGAWNLRYAIRDQVLRVTHDDDRASASQLRLYRVADLMARKRVSLEVLGELVIQGTAASGGGGVDAWAEEGGAGELVELGTQWLAVTATLQQHQRVEDLLTEWRTGHVPPRERERRLEASRGRWQPDRRSPQPASEELHDPWKGR
jgi:hypothetical protein